MTLMLASNHPELWQASCDMFGPYNLVTFLDRIPETWKTYFRLAVGDPEKDKEKIHIQSCDKQRARWQKILIDTTKSQEKVHIWGLCGTQEILIDSTAGKEMIRLTDKAGQTIVMNAAPGRERIQATDKSGSVIIMDGVMGNIVVQSSNKVLINP